MQQIKAFISDLDKSTLNNLALWMLIVPCSILSHTWLPVNPVLPFFIIALSLTLLTHDKLLCKDPIKLHKNLNKQLFIPFSFLSYILLSQYFMDSPFSRYFGLSIAITYFILTLVLLDGKEEKDIRKIVYWFIVTSVVVLTLEAILRFGYSFYTIANGTNFKYGIYRFKFEGPMYIESNGTAIHLLTILFFTFWWGEIQNKSFGVIKIILFILILLTLSRAAILAISIGLIYFYFFYNKSNSYRIKISLLFLIAFLFLIIIVIYPKIKSDDSFLSKFFIIEQALDYFKHASISEWIFGVGLSNSTAQLGIYAHNYFLVFLVETGILGLLLLISFFIFLIIATKGQALIVLLPFLVQTSTTTNTFLPYFYVVMGIMVWYENLYRKDHLSLILKDHQPLISICMPCYNAEKYIKQSIISIQNQEYKNWELLVVNDGSTDQTLLIINDFPLQDNRIKVISLKDNKGVSHARNVAIENAKGKYIAFLDSDDIATSDRLQRQLCFLETHAEIAACGSSVKYFQDENKIVRYPLMHKDILAAMLSDFPFTNSSLTIRKSSISDNHLMFDESLKYAEDYDFITRLKDHGELANLSHILNKYRVHKKNASTQLLQMHAATTSSIKTKIFCDYFSDTDNDFRLYQQETAIASKSYLPNKINIIEMHNHFDKLLKTADTKNIFNRDFFKKVLREEGSRVFLYNEYLRSLVCKHPAIYFFYFNQLSYKKKLFAGISTLFGINFALKLK